MAARLRAAGEDDASRCHGEELASGSLAELRSLDTPFGFDAGADSVLDLQQTR